jgi:hypothetical protein
MSGDPVEIEVRGALASAIRAAGLPLGSLRLIRIGNNYVYEDHQTETVYRVTVNPADPSALAIKNERLISLAASGSPIVPPLAAQPMQLPEGRLATAWSLGGAPKPNPVEALAPTLAALHQSVPPSGLSPWSGFDRARRRL